MKTSLEAFLRRTALHCALWCAVITLFVFSFSTSLFAQGASPLELGRRIVPDVVGVLVGPNFNYATGTFESGCPCTFTGGFGIGPVVGVMYEKNLFSPSPQWRLGTLNLGARLLYEQRNIAAAFLEYERTQVESRSQPGQFFQVPILFRHLAEGSFSMLTLTPYLSWSPFTQTPGFLQNVYFQVGLQGGYVLSSRIRHTKFVGQSTVTLPNGELSSVQIAIDSVTVSDRKVVQDSTFPRVNQIQLGLSIGAGADIPLGREGGRFRFTPLVQYVLPLTRISESGTNFTISSLQILLGVKMNLQDVSN